MLTHQTGHSMATTDDFTSPQLSVHARAAIGLATIFKHLPNMLDEDLMSYLSLTGYAPPPGIVPTARHLQYLAQLAHREFRPVFFDEVEFLSWSCEKIAIAFYWPAPGSWLFRNLCRMGRL
jgi:hypothetical protein